MQGKNAKTFSYQNTVRFFPEDSNKNVMHALPKYS